MEQVGWQVRKTVLKKTQHLHHPAFGVNFIAVHQLEPARGIFLLKDLMSDCFRMPFVRIVWKNFISLNIYRFCRWIHVDFTINVRESSITCISSSYPKMCMKTSTFSSLSEWESKNILSQTYEQMSSLQSNENNMFGGTCSTDVAQYFFRGGGTKLARCPKWRQIWIEVLYIFRTCPNHHFWYLCWESSEFSWQRSARLFLQLVFIMFQMLLRHSWVENTGRW